MLPWLYPGLIERSRQHILGNFVSSYWWGMRIALATISNRYSRWCCEISLGFVAWCIWALFHFLKRKLWLLPKHACFCSGHEHHPRMDVVIVIEKVPIANVTFAYMLKTYYCDRMKARLVLNREYSTVNVQCWYSCTISEAGNWFHLNSDFIPEDVECADRFGLFIYITYGCVFLSSIDWCLSPDLPNKHSRLQLLPHAVMLNI